jgi:hypothetical protein
MVDVVGQWLGRFTVPFRTITDFVAAVHPEEGLYRDVRGGIPAKLPLPDGTTINLQEILGPFDPTRLVAPAVGNIPGVAQFLPEGRSPLREGPIERQRPALRQLSGITIQRMTPLEREAASSAFYPRVRTGVPEADRFIKDYMGTTMERVTKRLVMRKEFRDKTPESKRYILGELATRYRRLAGKLLAKERPDLAQQVSRMGIDPDIRTGIIRRDPSKAALFRRR